jgi:small subunit ribosomal protein S4
MATEKKPACRLCRVEKTKLFIKGNKCLTDKCPIERRSYAPGQHGRARRRILGYAMQLREKQKLKRFYGMSEKQFKLFFQRAERRKGITGENLLSMLERRLDNVVFIMGFSHSRAQARQLITHGHFAVNDHKVSIPSFLVEEGDEIRVREKTANYDTMKELVNSNKNKSLPGWLEVDWDQMRGKIRSLPTRADVTLPVEEHLIVELYSK